MRGAATAFAQVSDSKPWAVQALAQMTNQAFLRRHLGVARSNDIAFDIADRIAGALPGVVATVIGRWTVEVETCVADASELQQFSDSLTEALAEPFDLDGERHHIDLAIGIAAGPPGMLDDVRLAEEAEDALVQSRNESQLVLRDLSQVDPMVDKIAASCSCNISPRSMSAARRLRAPKRWCAGGIPRAD
jgi:GGDEF domain-containing protein